MKILIIKQKHHLYKEDLFDIRKDIANQITENGIVALDPRVDYSVKEIDFGDTFDRVLSKCIVKSIDTPVGFLKEGAVVFIDRDRIWNEDFTEWSMISSIENLGVILDNPQKGEN